jgi:hypothetical protein
MDGSDWIVPMLLDTVERLQTTVGGADHGTTGTTSVDVYLVLGYTLLNDKEQALRRSLLSMTMNTNSIIPKIVMSLSISQSTPRKLLAMVATVL